MSFLEESTEYCTFFTKCGTTWSTGMQNSTASRNGTAAARPAPAPYGYPRRLSHESAVVYYTPPETLWNNASTTDVSGLCVLNNYTYQSACPHEWIECEDVSYGHCQAASTASGSANLTGTGPAYTQLARDKLMCKPTHDKQCQIRQECETTGECSGSTVSAEQSFTIVTKRVVQPSTTWSPYYYPPAPGNGTYYPYGAPTTVPPPRRELSHDTTGETYRYVTMTFSHACLHDVVRQDANDGDRCGIDKTNPRVQNYGSSYSMGGGGSNYEYWYDPLHYVLEAARCVQYNVTEAECLAKTNVDNSVHSLNPEYIATAPGPQNCGLVKTCQGGRAGGGPGGPSSAAPPPMMDGGMMYYMDSSKWQYSKTECEKCNGQMVSRGSWAYNTWIAQPKMIPRTNVKWTKRAMTQLRNWVSGVERMRLKDALRPVKDQLVSEEESTSVFCIYGGIASALTTVATVCSGADDVSQSIVPVVKTVARKEMYPGRIPPHTFFPRSS